MYAVSRKKREVKSTLETLEPEALYETIAILRAVQGDMIVDEIDHVHYLDISLWDNTGERYPRQNKFPIELRKSHISLDVTFGGSITHWMVVLGI